MAITKNDVSGLYVALFGKIADHKGLNYWVDEAGKGNFNIPTLINSMASTKEGKDALTSAGVDYAKDKGSFVKYLYTNLLNKADDAKGIGYWTDTANEKNADIGTLLGWILNAMNDPEVQKAGEKAYALYQNKLAVADEAVKLYDAAEKAGVTDEKFENYNSQYKQQLDNLLKNVTSDSSSVANAKAQLDDIFQDLSLNTLALTNDANDVVNGTPGNDKFTAVVDSLTSKSTLQSNDKINGEAGNDVLAVNLKANFNGFNKDGGLTNVETLELNNDTNTSKTFNAKGIDGLSNVVLKGDTATSVKNLDNIVKVEVAGQESGSVGISYNSSAIKGSDDTQTLVLDGVGRAKTDEAAQKDVDIKINGIENTNIQTKGSASFATISGSKAINISGSADLNLVVSDDKTTTVDASSFNANLDVNLEKAGNKLESVKGGAGDDTITVANPKAELSIDGGAGTDTIAISDLSATLKPKFDNIEKLSVVKASDSASVDMSDSAGITEISVGEVTNAKTVTVVNSKVQTLNLDGKGTGGGTVSVLGDQIKAVNFTNSNPAKSDTAEEIKGKTDLNNATELNIDISKLAKTTADNASIQAPAVINATLNIDEKTATGLTLANTVKLENLKIVNNADAFSLTAATLTNLNSLNLTSNGAFTHATGSDLINISELNLDGTGSVTLNGIGSATDENSIEINAKNLKTVTLGAIANKDGSDLASVVNLNDIQGNVTLGNVSTKAGFSLNTASVLGALAVGTIASDDVNINTQGTLGKVTLGNITAKVANVDLSDTLTQNVVGKITADTITYKNSQLDNLAQNSGNANSTKIELAANTNTEKFTADVTGSVKDDAVNITISANSSALKTISVSGDLGAGTDTVGFDATNGLGNAANVTTLDFSGVKNASTTISIGANKNTKLTTIKTGDGDDTITVAGLGENQVLTINGGAGKDTFDLKGATTDTSASKYVVLDGLNVGDVIQFASSGTNVIKGINELKDKDTGTKDVFDIGTGILKDLLDAFIGKEVSSAYPNDTEKTPYIFSANGDTYLLFNKAGTSHNLEEGDILVKLVGVSENFAATPDTSAGTLTITHL